MLKTWEAFLEKYLFYLIIFLMPLQKRFFLNSEFSFYNNFTIEYNQFYLSIFEVFLILLFLIRFKKDLFNFWFFLKRHSLIVTALIVAIFLNLFFSINFILSLHKYAHLFLWGYFIYVGIIKLKDWYYLQRVVQIIIITAVLVALIGIIQFGIQKSLSLTFLGESLLSPAIKGVAKIDWGSNKLIRTYSTFPHPNILSAYLLLATVLIYFYINNSLKNNFWFINSFYFYFKKKYQQLTKITKKKKNNSLNLNNLEEDNELKIVHFDKNKSLEKTYSIKNLFQDKFLQKFKPYDSENQKKEYSFLFFLNLIINLALILTFSRVGIGLLILFYLIVIFLKSNLLKKLALINLFFIGLILIMFSPYFFSRLVEKNYFFKDNQFSQTSEALYSKTDQSIRNLYLKISADVIREKPFWGVGAGNFVFYEIENNSRYQLPAFHLQPVHNLILLIISDFGIVLTGIIGVSFFVLLKSFKKDPLNLWISYRTLKIGIVLILLTGVFDHYLYSFPQGTAILGIIIALTIATYRINQAIFSREAFKRKALKRETDHLENTCFGNFFINKNL